jgi:hypothetical protein
MPKKLHDKLIRRALEKGFSAKHKDRYVYGTLAKLKKKERSKK